MDVDKVDGLHIDSECACIPKTFAFPNYDNYLKYMRKFFLVLIIKIIFIICVLF